MIWFLVGLCICETIFLLFSQAEFVLEWKWEDWLVAALAHVQSVSLCNQRPKQQLSLGTAFQWAAKESSRKSIHVGTAITLITATGSAHQ